MTSLDATKLCHACFNEIDVRAKKCPKCHALQGPLRNLLIACLFVLIFILIGSVIWFPSKILSDVQEHEFAGPNHADHIVIVSSKLYFIPGRDGKSVSIVGQIRNNAEVAVDRVSMEFRLMNKEGQLIDSYRQSISAHIEPGEDISFKLSNYQNIHLPEEDYVEHKVIVRSAKTR